MSRCVACLDTSSREGVCGACRGVDRPRPFLILARNRVEAERWRRRHDLGPSEALYVATPLVVAGIRFDDFAGVLVPGYYERADWMPISRYLQWRAAVGGTDYAEWLRAADERGRL